MPIKIHTGLVYTSVSAAIITIGVLAAIWYAQGNFRLTNQGYLAEAGLLSATSFPAGAQIFINDKLVSATDDTVYLEPNQYQLTISREGYYPWKKTINVEKGLVTQTNATLFPVAPSLTPLSYNGVNRVLPSPDGLKLLFVTASASADLSNGLYILDMNEKVLSFNRDSRQIAFDTTQRFDFATAQFIWSPDSSKILATSPTKQVLLEISKNTDISTLTDVSFRAKQLLSEWEEDMYLRERQFLSEFPPEIVAIATQSATNVYISPDKNRLLYTYTASASTTLPEGIVPPVPATNTQPEQRTLEAGNIYVYDQEEDKNFLIGHNPQLSTSTNKQLLATDLSNRRPTSLQASPSAFTTLQASTSGMTAERFHVYHSPVFAEVNMQWFPDSKHLLYTNDTAIHIKEYDNTNDTVIFSGPFAQNFVYPWPDGNRLIIMTSFRQDFQENLYAIELKR